MAAKNKKAISTIPGKMIYHNMDFIAVTQVKVSDKNEKDLFRTHFLNVSTSHIEIILPAE